jgi:hypothetical protein
LCLLPRCLQERLAWLLQQQQLTLTEEERLQQELINTQQRAPCTAGIGNAGAGGQEARAAVEW